jgi:hypothetical protein
MLLMACTACTPLSPPPLFARHEGAAADQKGAVTIALVAGIGGEALGAGLGLELRAAWQVDDDVQLGVGIGGGFGDPSGERSPPSTKLLAARVFTRVNPGGATHFALLGGAGVGGSSTGARWITLDLGAITSGVIGDTVEPHVSGALALSIPVAAGRPIVQDGAEEIPATTLYVGGAAGVLVHIDDNAFSLELGAYAARAPADRRAGVFYLSLGDAQTFRP